MTTCLLHGGFTREDNELNRKFYKAFASHIPDGGTVLYVYFATKDEEEADNDKRFAEHQGFIERYAEGKRFTHVQADKERFVAQLASAQAVFINGGTPVKLMTALRAVPNIRELLTGKVCAGSSSGAYALSTYYYSVTPSEGVYEGLGVLPVKVICHYESDSSELVRGPEAIAALEKYPRDLELVVLRDFEYKECSI